MYIINIKIYNFINKNKKKSIKKIHCFENIVLESHPIFLSNNNDFTLNKTIIIYYLPLITEYFNDLLKTILIKCFNFIFNS